MVWSREMKGASHCRKICFLLLVLICAQPCVSMVTAEPVAVSVVMQSQVNMMWLYQWTLSHFPMFSLKSFMFHFLLVPHSFLFLVVCVLRCLFSLFHHLNIYFYCCVVPSPSYLYSSSSFFPSVPLFSFFHFTKHLLSFHLSFLQDFPFPLFLSNIPSLLSFPLDVYLSTIPFMLPSTLLIFLLSFSIFAVPLVLSPTSVFLFFLIFSVPPFLFGIAFHCRFPFPSL